ncbi:ankyrin repeat domain-containing protein [Alkalilimnicola ehrlichii]|uniref:ankyrin repeat domain-containing protein n=1 Tax=Alkalilimnicola ehrlichii TaxID=351052 RepID=UPI001C6ECE96|nr:ankyrin repeat domain-containing protein [Alkalilimnicola ehrlichii]
MQASNSPCDYLVETVPANAGELIERSDGSDELYGKSIVYYAAVLGKANKISEWVQNADWATLDPEILSGAVIAGRPNVVNALLQAGASPDWQDASGMTPLLAAASCERSDMVALLIDAGANIQTPNKDGLDPMLQAITLGDLDTIEILLESGFDLSQARLANGLGPMDIAQLTENEEVINTLSRYLP